MSRPRFRGSWRATLEATLKTRTLAILVASMLLWGLSTDLALAGRRVALVIGNSAYQNVAKLPNPSRDAKAVAEMFKTAGFDVVDAEIDVEYLDFKRALRRFEDAAADADIAVVYYAGHGIEIGGRNYLIPINAKLASDRDAQDEAIPLDRLVMSAEPATQLRLIILDACRDNPFARTMKRQRYVRSIGQGLGKVEPADTNTLIAYASKAGSTAEDGTGEHSPFTYALLKNLVVPGLDIRLAFGRVRDDVLKRTGHRQEPFVYGSLGGSNVSLVAPPEVPKAPSVAEAKGDYDLVERIGTRKAWEVFLKTYNSGLYAELARAQLAKLTSKEQVASPPQPAASKTVMRMKMAELEAKPPAPEPKRAAAAPKMVVAKPKPLAATPKTAAAAPKTTEIASSKPAAEPKAAATSAPAPSSPAANEPPPQSRTKIAALEPEPVPKSPSPLAEDQKAWDRIKDSSDPKAYSDFIDRYPDSVLAPTARKHLSALEDAARERERQARQDQEGAKHRAVLAAQQELNRIGCFEGAADGIAGPATRAAIDRYFAASGRKANDDNDVTDKLVADLKKETSHVCPLECGSGEVARGNRCVAEQHEPARERRRKADRDDRPRRERYASEPRHQSRSRPRQEVSSRPHGGGGGGSVVGVGF